MKMEYDELMQRYLSGLATEEESRALEALLIKDDGLADRYLRLIELDVALEAEAEGRGERVVSAKPRRIWLPLAAAACAVIGLFMGWPSQQAPLQVADVVGVVTWTAEGEKMPTDVVKGMTVSAGTITTANDLSTAQLQWADGTRITLTGGAEVAVADENGKLVTVKRGAFTANVAPQPRGRPLRVRTPTAELVVVGTAFGLDAGDGSTQLAVTEGRVKMRRLADDRVVEVGADQQATVTELAMPELRAGPQPFAPMSWVTDFKHQRPETTGSWIAKDGEVSIGAKSFNTKLRVDGAPLVMHGLAVRGWRLAKLNPDSVLRVKLRLQRHVPLQLMVSTLLPNGEFGGNFENHSAELQPAEAEGWQTVHVPLHEFSPRHSELSTQPAGNSLRAVIVTTLTEDAGLEVAEMALLPGDEVR
jgi:hypothetical protein